MAGIDWGLPGPRAGIFWGISDRGGQSRETEELPTVVFSFPGRSSVAGINALTQNGGRNIRPPFCVPRNGPGVYSRSSRLRTFSETKNDAAISTSQKTMSMANLLITFIVGGHFFGRQFAAVHLLPDPTHVGKDKGDSQGHVGHHRQSVVTARGVVDGQAAGQIRLGRIEGGVVEPGEEEDRQAGQYGPQPRRPDAAHRGGKAVERHAGNDEQKPRQKERQHQRHLQQVVQVLVGFHGHRARPRIDGEAVHRQQADEHVEQKGEGGEEIGERGGFQPCHQVLVAEVVGQVEGAEGPGEKDQKKTEGEVEEAEGGFESPQRMGPPDQIVVVEDEVGPGKKGADCGADEENAD